MVSFYFWTEQIQKTVVVCKINRSLIGIKQFLYFTHQYLEKRISVIDAVKLFLVLSTLIIRMIVLLFILSENHQTR